jgi:hypothetical protein
VDEALAYLASGAAPAVVRSIGDAGEVARMPEPGRDPDPTVHSLSTFEPAVVERAEAEPAAFWVHIGPSTDSRLHFGQVRVRARWS